MRTGPDLGGQDFGVAVEEESEVAGEVERTGEPLAGGHDEHRPAVGGVEAEVGDGRREGGGVGGGPVTHRPEIRQARLVGPAAGGTSRRPPGPASAGPPAVVAVVP